MLRQTCIIGTSDFSGVRWARHHAAMKTMPTAPR